MSHACEEEAQVIINFGDGCDGRAGIAHARFLFDGNRRREALDAVHIRFFHKSKELASIGRERFDISPLSLGIEGVEREA